jgi:hypothetical protein
MSKSISKAVLKKANRKDGLGLDIRIGADIGSSGPGLRPMYAFLRAIESEKGWRPRVYVDGQGSIRLRIDTIITDTSQGLHLRGIVRTWAKGDIGDNALAYYISAGGGGYDMLTAATRGIKVYDNDDVLVEIGDHCDDKGRLTLEVFAYGQGLSLIHI